MDDPNKNFKPRSKFIMSLEPHEMASFIVSEINNKNQNVVR